MVVAIRRKYYTALLPAPNVTTNNNKKNCIYFSIYKVSLIYYFDEPLCTYLTTFIDANIWYILLHTIHNYVDICKSCTRSSCIYSTFLTVVLFHVFTSQTMNCIWKFMVEYRYQLIDWSPVCTRTWRAWSKYWTKSKGQILRVL